MINIDQVENNFQPAYCGKLHDSPTLLDDEHLPLDVNEIPDFQMPNVSDRAKHDPPLDEYSVGLHTPILM